ncbi:hypothetical protein C479_02266 [Halovivax asiaticus JCM 14624]|uniref:DUF4157 domain-containing protein n=1 Tax=Halovivax asiaticus JCM 14624 TaxID=1227490 RepID=M0BU42_9EURY|nr:hypothetical protein [Halovivax asiaticus]ELZ13632.1 hypothetical protein C479_02266 [Halovivax asiaticus JCM 14624]
MRRGRRTRRQFVRAGAAALGATLAGCSNRNPTPTSEQFRFEGVGDGFVERTETVYDRLTDIVGASIHERTTIERITPSEMRERAETYPVVGGSRTQKLAYRALGLTERLDADRSFEFAGSYDPASTTIRLVGTDDAAIDDQLLAHELFHAIQFQTGSLDEWNRSWSVGFDRYSAQQAVVEGTAMFVEDEYVDGCGGDFAHCQLADPTRISPGSLDPALLLQYGSYFNGYDFASALAARGGWEQIWASHDDPPISSGQILHPAWYPDRHPEPVTAPSEPGDGWTLLDTERLGMQALFTTLWQAGALPTEAVYTRSPEATDEVYASLIRYRAPVTDQWRGDAFTGFERDDGAYGWYWRIRFADTAAAETGFEHVRHWAESRGAQTDRENVWTSDGRYEAIGLDDEDVLVWMAPELADFAALAPEYWE